MEQTEIIAIEVDEAAVARREAALSEIGMSLERLKDEAVAWRAQFEHEWTESYNQYNSASRQPLPNSKRQGAQPSADEPAFRQTADNITRPKVIITASRLGDMLFPTNDANWTMEAPKRPSIPDDLLPPPPQQTDEQGNPVPSQGYTPEQLLQVKKQVADRRCAAMRNEIGDQLNECSYAEHGRAAIFDACLYGPGVLRAPLLRNKTKHTYEGQGFQRKVVKSAKPVAEHIDLWSFFPQPCRSIEECEHAMVLHLLPRRGVRKLADHPGFDREQIARLLKDDPVHGALAQSALSRGALRPDSDAVLSNRYSVWEFRGPMPKDAFRAFAESLALQELIGEEELGEMVREMEEDPLHEIDCEVWFSQGVVIKMAMSTLSRGELGFYVFNYEDDPNAIFGHGVPYLCRDDQHAANQLWHAMMLNSLMSAGPQIGVRKGSLMSEGRNTVLSADRPRVWPLNDDVQNINHALSVFIIPNITQSILGLYERVKANADEHTMTPLIAQGEPTSAVPTSSGLAMLMNAANVIMRRLAKHWDDSITLPLITAMYDWNMAHSDAEDIKGDYCVIPRGASHLLIKDVQAQHVQYVTTLFSSNPMLQPYMKPGVFARKNVEMLDIAPDDLLYTDDEVAQIQAQQAEQPDPEAIKAQASQATAEAALKRAEVEQEVAADNAQWQREERMIAHTERMADIEGRKQIQAMQLKGQQLSIIQSLAQMESDERVAMRKIIADLEAKGGSLDLQQYQVDSQSRLEAERIAKDERQFEREIEVEGADARVQ